MKTRDETNVRTPPIVNAVTQLREKKAEEKSVDSRDVLSKIFDLDLLLLLEEGSGYRRRSEIVNSDRFVPGRPGRPLPRFNPRNVLVSE